MLALTLLYRWVVPNPPDGAEPYAQWAISVLCFGFFAAKLYRDVWQIALHDRNMELYDHYAPRPMKWLIASAIASLPGIACIAYAVGTDVKVNAGVAFFLYAHLLAPLSGLWDLGLKPLLFAAVGVTVLITAMGYKMGHAARYLRDGLMFRRSDEEPRAGGLKK
jgi:hypothetical protein